MLTATKNIPEPAAMPIYRCEHMNECYYFKTVLPNLDRGSERIANTYCFGHYWTCGKYRIIRQAQKD
jgi:hypothetical protein